MTEAEFQALFDEIGRVEWEIIELTEPTPLPDDLGRITELVLRMWDLEIEFDRGDGVLVLG